MKTIHFVRTDGSPCPFCANRIDMAKSGNFETTNDEDQVTCKLCLMRLGIIEDTRGRRRR
jgi:hypothetical protein